MSNLKFLVLGVSCGITVLGMNSVYADDSSIKEFLNEKEAYGFEVKVKKPSPVQVKKTSNVNHSHLHPPYLNRLLLQQRGELIWIKLNDSRLIGCQFVTMMF